jgi:hypothetical protein
MLPSEGHLSGQPIARFVPELQHAFRREEEGEFRASMQCQVHRGNGEICPVEVWFSTYKERGVPKLAAIIADVTEEQAGAVSSGAARPEGTERPTLNDRQLAVLRLLFEGLQNNQIASRLAMTPSAVKNTFQQLFAKAGKTAVHLGPDSHVRVGDLTFPVTTGVAYRVALLLRAADGRELARNVYVDPFHHPPHPDGHPQRMDQELGMRLWWAGEGK